MYGQVKEGVYGYFRVRVSKQWMFEYAECYSQERDRSGGSDVKCQLQRGAEASCDEAGLQCVSELRRGMIDSSASAARTSSSSWSTIPIGPSNHFSCN